MSDEVLPYKNISNVNQYALSSKPPTPLLKVSVRVLELAIHSRLRHIACESKSGPPRCYLTR